MTAFGPEMGNYEQGELEERSLLNAFLSAAAKEAFQLNPEDAIESANKYIAHLQENSNHLPSPQREFFVAEKIFKMHSEAAKINPIFQEFADQAEYDLDELESQFGE